MLTRVLAVDLGATSGRVCAVQLDDPDAGPQVLHRFAHAPVADERGRLRWDWPTLMAGVEAGLDTGLASGPVASIGIDTWGVDYGLLDGSGALVSAPYCYRDRRTDHWRETVERIGADALFQRTGIQLAAFNTLFQLAVHDREELDRAQRLLMLPELVVHALTGASYAERTSASTSQLIDIATGTWSAELLNAIDVERGLFADIAPTGTFAGVWRDVPVHIVAGHDSASAMAAVPPSPGRAVVSAGTWLIVGVARAEPVVTPNALAASFSNEAAAFAGVRLVKNVGGFWLLEQCRRRWGDRSVADLADAALGCPPGPTVDSTDARFLAPADMVAEVCAAAGLTTDDPAIVTRCILDSLAATTATVLDEIERVTGEPVVDVALVGGGVRVPGFADLLASACGREVVRGPVEATALGNALVQGAALGLRAA